MPAAKNQQNVAKSRAFIAKKVQELRHGRRWTQAELSRRIGLSQSRFSEIEGGAGSFTAEQFLEILRLFNVTASDFAPSSADAGTELQNALARLGAHHLHESTDVVPSERLGNVGDVVREAIVAGEFPRLITALAPVIVRNIDRINLKKLHLDLTGVGLERRLVWVIENTLEAIRRDAPEAPPASRRLYNRARVVLESFCSALPAKHPRAPAPDVFDSGIRSKQTLEEVTAASSSTSRRWGIVTSLQPEDFLEALRGARAAR